MIESILASTKKNLGLADDYTAFDAEILLFINGVFSTLNQLGIGPADGFSIEDDTATWDTFTDDDPKYNSVKTYMYLKVRMLFDPPQTSYLINALNEQARELEWRLNVLREETAWVDPDPELVLVEE